MARRTALLALVAFSMTAAACAVHEPVPVFRSGVFVSDRGISVPLPPPSLTSNPKQKVDVEGSVAGEDEVVDGTVLHVIDNRGDGDVSVELPAGAESFAVSVDIDVSDSCLEMWLVAPDGAESDRSLVSTQIAQDDQSVDTVQGCDE
jgi:hypothetical protein